MRIRRWVSERVCERQDRGRWEGGKNRVAKLGRELPMAVVEACEKRGKVDQMIAMSSGSAAGAEEVP